MTVRFSDSTLTTSAPIHRLNAARNLNIAAAEESRAPSRFGHLGLEGALGNLHELVEGGVIGRGDVGNDFAVQRYFGGLETFHQPAVGGAGSPRGGIDADLPKGSEV